MEHRDLTNVYLRVKWDEKQGKRPELSGERALVKAPKNDTYLQRDFFPLLKNLVNLVSVEHYSLSRSKT